MLSTMRSSWLLFVLMALVAMTAAFSVEDALNIDGINAYLHHGQKRQAQGTGVSSADTPSSSADAPSSTPDAPSSSAAAPSTSAAAPTTAAAPSSDNNAPSSTPQASPGTSANTPAGNPTSAAPTKAPQSTSLSTKQLISTEIAPTTVVFTIVSNGQTSQQTSVGSRTIEHTTGSVVETSLSNAQSNNSGGGLSSTNKSIIGGVVGGVGGAILLGGIALVCWRMWGKKKRVSEDDADLMAGTGSALGDKSHSGASPFQSNLEQYHNPGGRPNAAANF